VHKLRHSGIAQETASRRAEVIRSMIHDLTRTIQIIRVDICTEEERARVFNKADPLYPVLARTLECRRENLVETVAALRQQFRAIKRIATRVVAKAA
jgi:hypothetical protein